MKNIFLLLLGAVIFCVLIFARTDFEGLRDIVSLKLSWSFYLLIVLSVPLQQLVRGYRFMALYGDIFGRKTTFFKAFILTSASLFVALATPNKIGDLSRGFLARDYPLDTLAVSVVEYVFDVTVVLLIPLFGLLIFSEQFFWHIFAAYASLALAVSLALLFFRRPILLPLLSRYGWFSKHEGRLGLLADRLQGSLSFKKALFKGFLLTGIFYGIYFLFFFAVLRKLGAPISLLETTLAAGTGVFLGSLSFVPMGMGTRDVTAYGLLVALGTASGPALSAVVVMRSLSLPLIVTSGICYFWTVHSARE